MAVAVHLRQGQSQRKIVGEQSEEAEEEQDKNTRNPYIPPTSTSEVTGAKTWFVRRQTHLDTTGVSTHNRLAESCQYSLKSQSEVHTDIQPSNHTDTQSRAYGHVYSIEFTHILQAKQSLSRTISEQSANTSTIICLPSVTRVCAHQPALFLQYCDETASCAAMRKIANPHITIRTSPAYNGSTPRDHNNSKQH